jgi:recombinational DNA repair protein (RecF pathway)
LWIVWPFLKFLTLFHFSDERENEKFFTMFLTLLRTLVKTRDPLHGRLLIYGFALKSLMITSMIQNIRYCYDCSEKISPPAYFEPEKGLVLCGNCRINYYHTLDFSESFYTFLTKIIYSRFEEIIYFITDSPQLENVKNFLDILCTHQLGKRWTNFEPEENPFDHESEIRENPLPQR